MEKYIIQGIYPNGDTMTIEVNATSCMDAFAVAQGLRKVTTLKEATVTSTALTIEAKFGQVMDETYDSYKVNPPCASMGECSGRCPYTHECWGDDTED